MKLDTKTTVVSDIANPEPKLQSESTLKTESTFKSSLKPLGSTLNQKRKNKVKITLNKIDSSEYNK